MTWQSRLENIEFTIVTGEGSTFTPLWKNGETTRDYNVTEYNFINLNGSFVDRKRPQGNVYPLIFWFQGQDNIEQANEFLRAADDNRAWTVTHPFYDTIIGHPQSITRSDIDYNVTQFTVNFLESIEDDSPRSETSVRDQARSMVQSINLEARTVVTEDLVTSAENVNELQDQLNLVVSNIEVPNNNFDSFTNLVNSARSAIDDITADGAAAYESLQNIYLEASQYSVAVATRLENDLQSYNDIKRSILENGDAILNQANQIIGNVTTALNDDLSTFDRINYEIQSASIIGSMCNAAVNPIVNDYITRIDIQNVRDIIIRVYNDYLTTLDRLQVSIYNTTNSWSPSARVQRRLSEAINFTLKSLFRLSFDAKQERIIELETDSNLITLTHRFLGLANDENINTFRELNNIKNEELFNIPKGRMIKYFV